MGEGASRVCYTLYQGVHHVECWVVRVDSEGVHPWVRVPHASATLCIRVYNMSGVGW